MTEVHKCYASSCIHNIRVSHQCMAETVTVDIDGNCEIFEEEN